MAQPITVEVRTEIEIQTEVVDENTCKNVFDNMLKRIALCQEMVGDSFNTLRS